MLKNYRSELVVISIIFGLIAYGINIAMAAPVPTAPAAVAALKKNAEPAKKADKPATKPAEPKKDPNRKKPTLKKKFKK